ncbi:MAG: protease SohB [Endozoicomonadaceae bacterium]|nr:protease SohB [Endozoicomonadaceae bacterium]
MEFWLEIGLFASKTIILIFFILIILSLIGSLIHKVKQLVEQHDGQLIIKSLNARFHKRKNQLREKILDKKAFKSICQLENKQNKQKKKNNEPEKSLYVINFNGDTKASKGHCLSQEISAILAVATSKDEVLVNIESPGGYVHSYGFVTAQLERIVQHAIRLVVSIDKVAASGGYVMACVADHIIAAPLAIVGSIGVVAQMPNINRLLKKNEIDIEMHTAGEYKRTLTLVGENTEKGRAKFKEDLEKTHELIKKHVKKHRNHLNIEEVATGEIWYGQRAIECQLVDQLETSEEYIWQAIQNNTNVYQVELKLPKKNLINRLSNSVESAISSLLSKAWNRLTTSRQLL